MYRPHRVHTRSAALVAYHTAPAMLMQMPTVFHRWYRKSPKANTPTPVMSTFFRLPATLVVSGSLCRVHTNVEWLMVNPSAQLSTSVACAQQRVQATVCTVQAPSLALSGLVSS